MHENLKKAICAYENLKGDNRRLALEKVGDLNSINYQIEIHLQKS